MRQEVSSGSSGEVRVQLVLRTVLVVFVVGTLLALPPQRDPGWCWLLLSGYAAWVLGTGIAAAPRGRAVRASWTALVVDAVALGALTLIAGASARDSWTAYVLVQGLFLVVVLASVQPRPAVAAAVQFLAVGVYAVSSTATREANGEPWASLLLRTGVVAGIALAGVLLSRAHRGRLQQIGVLAADREGLLTQLSALEQRERQELAEALHDGALQYVLAARLDLDDAREGSPEALDRIEHALTTSSRLLRGTVGQLHPAVLQQAGLVAAVRDLAETTCRPGLIVGADAAGWPAGLRTEQDPLLFGAIRELLANVVKHAGATRARVDLTLLDGEAVVEVVDDGRGVPAGAATAAPAAGHVGLASHRLRVAAAGGSLRIGPTHPHGTTVRIVLPVELLPAAPLS